MHKTVTGDDGRRPRKRRIGIIIGGGRFDVYETTQKQPHTNDNKGGNVHARPDGPASSPHARGRALLDANSNLPDRLRQLWKPPNASFPLKRARVVGDKKIAPRDKKIARSDKKIAPVL